MNPIDTSLRPLQFASIHRRRFLNELKDFVRFPSISAQPRHASDVRQCAHWLANHLRQLRPEHVHIVSTKRHPLVHAAWPFQPDRPTVLIYGHYDVQPVDPIKDWQSPPFEPTVRGRDLFGRGASDDKGQLFTHLKALEAYLRTSGTLPVNVKCLFEGEEEIGSPNLPAFVGDRRRTLAADVALVSDTRILGPDRPALTYALRGGLAMEMEVKGPRHDLHSGNFGGAIANPLEALCALVAGFQDADARITIPGFYEDVRPVPAGERAYLRQMGPTPQEILHDAAGQPGRGEPGYTLYERITLRPSLTVNGITGGYQGPGGKAILPGRAVAKVGFRLVADQNPARIEQLFRHHVARKAPPGVRIGIRTLSRANPVVIERRHPAIRAASWAYTNGFGRRPVFLRSGGSIPIVNTFQEVLGVPTVLMGFALPDDRMHAPNEKFHLPNFYRGIDTCIHFLAALAGRQQATSDERLARARP
jgi:acetylornithine deacetylase/succinyl-diaminopimelate desuccinylase-like protein